ncbi:hypothetical protein A9Q99_05055 [Gammaproteobacteria bacterium 45_16_T64]|nr:hypothetical protein A9Q99_05055 [Gammaproteobacteria bacterium 45_16_T64]
MSGQTESLTVMARMKKRFLDLPIRRKLMVIIGVALWVAMLVAAIAFIIYDEQTSRNRLSREMQVLAQVIAERSGAAIAFGDTRAANANVASFAFHPAVLSACLIARISNDAIGEYQRKIGPDSTVVADSCVNMEGTTAKINASAAFIDGHLKVTQPVILKSKTIGVLRLNVSLEQIQQRRWQFALVALLIQLVAGLLAYLLTARLQRMITDPLQDLSIVAEKVTGTHDYSLRASKQGGDEVGAVVVAFNDMLHTIQEANHKLHEVMLELQEKREQSEAYARSANDRREEISEYFGGVSHDLRQPLHAMGLFVESLQMNNSHRIDPVVTPIGELPDDTHLLGQLTQSIDHLTLMLTELLDVSKLDAGVKQAKLSTFAIRPMLQRIANDFAVLAEDKLIRFSLSIFDERYIASGALSVHSDPIMLERVVRNLLSNAVRYTEEGGVLIACRVRKNATVSIEIWDTGKGIPTDQQDNIFDAHRQLNNEKQDESKGFGLGLSVVKRLTDTLEHSLSLKSEEGRGSVFKITLPHVTIMESTSHDEPSEAVHIHNPFLHKSILLVDDDTSIRAALGDLMQSWGADVIRAGEYEALPALLEAATVDMIVTDYNLPNQRTGLDVISLVHKQFPQPIPSIIITGETDAAVFEAIGGAGYSYLAKPVKVAKLRSALEFECKRRV